MRYWLNKLHHINMTVLHNFKNNFSKALKNKGVLYKKKSRMQNVRHADTNVGK